jgi:uncharacterized membrane protein (UPF0127 family)
VALINTTNGIVLAKQTILLDSWTGRFLGVMGRTLRPGQSVGISACDWVHTFFVRCPLDLIYCDPAGSVLKVVFQLPSNRWGPRIPGSFVVWELLGGTINGESVAVGDSLVVKQ